MADTTASVSSEQSSSDWCECCHQFCTDASRLEFAKRFETFAQRRELEWNELKYTPPALQPGTFPVLQLPRELRNKIYNSMLGAKTGTTKYQYVTHDHIFPTQILYLNRQLRNEFLDEFFGSAFVMCQYSINPKHIELLIPPATLFPRIKHFWARLVNSDMHCPAPSWKQILHDTKLLLEMFPNLLGTSLVFKGVYKEDKAMDETDLVEAWESSELRHVEAVRRVAFELEGPRKTSAGVRVQRQDGYLYLRSGAKSARVWTEKKDSKEKFV
ncbi:hypothetical protein N0V90_009059 [Kalmusia sp. IMI 367209]|nr:hypothetical protein N0V90_009059 [Kalmusia sp. IMI 367209]